MVFSTRSTAAHTRSRSAGAPLRRGHGEGLAAEGAAQQWPRTFFGVRRPGESRDFAATVGGGEVARAPGPSRGVSTDVPRCAGSSAGNGRLGSATKGMPPGPARQRSHGPLDGSVPRGGRAIRTPKGHPLQGAGPRRLIAPWTTSGGPAYAQIRVQQCGACGSATRTCVGIPRCPRWRRLQKAGCVASPLVSTEARFRCIFMSWRVRAPTTATYP